MPPAARPIETLPEPELNALLRGVDWRFLIRRDGWPLAVDLGGGADARALGLAVAPEEAELGTAEVALIGRPSGAALAAALGALRPGGAVVARWRLPVPGGSGRALERMRAAGLSGVRIYWTGPLPHRRPEFWLPLDSAEALAHLLRWRPPASRGKAALRPLWRLAARAGMLAPLCAIGRLPGGEDGDDAVTGVLGDQPTLLLTGGRRSINKVVGLPFPPSAREPEAVVKFARVPAADAALEQEVETLRLLEGERPGVPGIPRVLADGRRAGRRAVAETAIFGAPLISRLTAASFAELSGAVSGWLEGLVETGRAVPQAGWNDRLVARPLEELERNFGAVLEPATLTAVRRLLSELGDLPHACEHRDCSPWNIVLDGERPALLDWESAEPRGLPGLDLAYFLATAAFIIEGALESGRTREAYARLLDPRTTLGRAAADCAASHCERVGIEPVAYKRLRLLCWVVHSRSDRRHLEMAAGGEPAVDELRESTFLGLIEEELRATGSVEGVE